MKTCTFIFWISLLVLFWHSVLSKSPTNKEHYSIDSENLNEESEIDVGTQDVALQESFRPRHKYKPNGHRTRFYRSNSENGIDQEAKAPPCAVMYKDNEPVGILQPFKESYRFLPVSGDPTLVDINPIPVKRKTIMDVLYPNKITQDYNDETAENNNQFADDRYPSIFAKFKIDSRLDKILNPDLNLKRSMYKRDTEKPDISDEQVNSLKTTLSKMNGDNSAVVEEELKNILDDMGLIDDYDNRQAKREVVAEDEDLEQGTNKINLIKEEHNETRNKRRDAKATTEQGQSARSALASTDTTIAVPSKELFEEERTGEMDSIDLLKDGDVKLNDNSGTEKLEVSTEIEREESRKKRQFGTSGLKEDNRKEDKGDATGTLPDVNINHPSLVKEAELTQYEKRVEREIRDKIQKLKEEVKEEIRNLKKNPDVNDEESDARRKKRQVINTLMDEETQDIDPNFNDEGQHDEHHVRCKRSPHFDNSSISSELDINNQANQSKLNIEQTVDLKSSPNFDNKSESNKEETIKDNSEKTELKANFKVLTNTTKDPNTSLNIKYNAIHNNDCSDRKCSIHNNKRERISLKTKRDSLHKVKSVPNNMDTINPKDASFETKRKKNIIRILNVIGKKNYNYTVNNKRFIGINPILENNTAHSTNHYYYMKGYATDGVKRHFESNHDKGIDKSDAPEDTNADVNTILKKAVNYTDHYKSRSLKQVAADNIVTNLKTEMVVRKKRSVPQNNQIENDPSDKVNTRIKKQAKDDLEENDYQYDNSEFNEDAEVDNQAYEDQPYANESNDADNLDSNVLVSNVNSHCNCEKTGSGCKCETQKNDLNVPNIKQYYSDYVENPSNIIEKKSINHCHCDKNGKHCKCQTFREGSEYNDYAQEQPTGIEKSADIDDDAALDEAQSGIEERGPRRPRQRRKHAAGGIMNLNKEDPAESYYGNYDMETDRLMKRETKLKKQPENQPFQNGEYFVDLHPNTYRLTPIDAIREKRDNIKDLIAIHSGGPVMNHLAAIRQRSMLPHYRIRRRIQNDDNKEPRQLIDMSDEDIFGALPQSFAGELARYKRVKRGKTEK